MNDFYQKITEGQGTVEDVLRRIPGLKKHLELNDRRAADEMLREHIVRRLEEQLQRFDMLKQNLLDQGGLAYMEKVQRIDTKLRTFIDRIDTAAEGYAGLLAKVKVDEEALARIYAFDSALMTYQDQFATGLDQLEAAIGGETDINNVLAQLDAIMTEANNTFKRRVEAIQALEENNAV